MPAIAPLSPAFALRTAAWALLSPARALRKDASTPVSTAFALLLLYFALCFEALAASTDAFAAMAEGKRDATVARVATVVQNVCQSPANVSIASLGAGIYNHMEDWELLLPVPEASNSQTPKKADVIKGFDIYLLFEPWFCFVFKIGLSWRTRTGL